MKFAGARLPQMRVPITLVAILAVCLPVPATQAQEARAQRGYAYAQTHCASCHAIGRIGESPIRSAPAFRTLHRRYAVESLEESLAEGIVTGHPMMPRFHLDVAQIGDLIAYLKSLE
jgi:cytochrome c